MCIISKYIIWHSILLIYILYLYIYEEFSGIHDTPLPSTKFNMNMLTHSSEWIFKPMRYSGLHISLFKLIFTSTEQN